MASDDLTRLRSRCWTSGILISSLLSISISMGWTSQPHHANAHATGADGPENISSAVGHLASEVSTGVHPTSSGGKLAGQPYFLGTNLLVHLQAGCLEPQTLLFFIAPPHR